MKLNTYESNSMNYNDDIDSSERLKEWQDQKIRENEREKEAQTKRDNQEGGSSEPSRNITQHNKKLALGMAMALLIAPLAASAQGNHHGYMHDWNSGYAPITQVTPHYETYMRNNIRNVCSNESAYNDGYEHNNEYNSYRDHEFENTDHHRTRNGILGAVIGGALGNQVGKGDGRKAATIGGAVIGGAIGANHNDYDRNRYGNDNYNVNYRHNEGQHCERMSTPVSYREVNGYDVTYVYHGKEDHVFTTRYPQGGYIKIE